MKPVMQAVASIVASILATWLLRRLVMSSDGGHDGASPGRGGIAVVLVPITVGNHYHVKEPESTGRRRLGFRKADPQEQKAKS